MCNFKTLFHSEHGCAVKCRKCGHIQLAFGTTAMALTVEQFDQFLETIKDLRELHQHTMFPNQKCVNIPTAAKGLVLVYSLSDLELLNKMLDKVREKLEREKLLEREQSWN